ncbi:MAG: lactate racemase domain-containing protein [Atribacterota bacterium]|nr:lactate racemase domain-containing protein [Atribacterota bacterium]MDD4896385.1 lactate racemase domain-containing protein [Atribacterota bacterium]MDD5637878.1 lactate racemase domain-containing protein [Atribacterota bacterium]
MLFIEELQGELTDDQLRGAVAEAFKDFSQVKKALLIHPDYSRVDFTDRLVPIIYWELKKKHVAQIDSLNAGGTHRKMVEQEIRTKLGLKEEIFFTNHYNHQFDNPEQLVQVGEIDPSFVSEQTKQQLKQSLPVVVNRLILDDYDLIIALSGTSPHESAGYAGGLKVFFPGISGPEVIDLLHWAAVLVGIPEIIGTIDNPARRVINEGSSYIFKAIKAPVISFNMLLQEVENNKVIPKGLYVGSGYNGFQEAYQAAALASSKIHIIYIDQSLEQAVQVMDLCYDEFWTAGKGSYKLQSPGVMTKGGEIIIYAPHIHRFHSQKDMEKSIRELGYHCKDYVLKYLQKFPDTSRNVAAHVINVRGSGIYNPDDGEEKCDFQVILATGIPESVCQDVGLGYRDPNTIHKEDYMGSKQLWIEHGGKYLYQLRKS